MRTRHFTLLTISLLACTAVPAFAQQGVVIMRKPMHDTFGDPTKVGVAVWKTGEWGPYSTTCGMATQSRTVSCVNGEGAALDPRICNSAQRPDASQSIIVTSGCTYDWQTSDWSHDPACGSTTQTRTVQCVRSDVTVVPDATCVQLKGPAPARSQTVTDYGACTYQWAPGDWSPWSTTCGQATQTRTVGCQSSDGRAVADSFCTGTKPETGQSAYQTSGCGYEWKPGAFGAPMPSCGATTQSRTVTCLRSDGQTVDDASCPAGSKPSTTQPATDYSTCTYAWSSTAWSPWSSTCGQATHTRTVTCLSSDGRTVADSFCTGAKPEVSQSSYETSGCGYTWQTGTFGSAVPACGATVQNRTVTCLRSDGQIVADGACDAGSRPSATQPATDYSTCTYGWTTGSWSAWSSSCGSATQSRSVTCQSSDGRTVADSFCTGTKPDSTQSAYQTSGCSYSWQTGTPSAPAPACGATTQTRTVTCKRSDGQTVSDGACDAGTRPSNTVPATDYSTCSYSWAYGAWSNPSTSCGNGTQTRSVTCQRSDGTTVADANCPTSTKPPSSQATYQTTSCTYSWGTPGPWGPTATSCGSTDQTRTVPCMRSDGTEMTDQTLCTAPKPATTQTVNNPACTYTPTYGNYSTCTNSTQSANIISCQRSDGADVATSFCSPQTVSRTCQAVITCGTFYTSAGYQGTVTSYAQIDHLTNAAAVRSWCESKATVAGVCLYDATYTSDYSAQWIGGATIKLNSVRNTIVSASCK